MRIATLRQRTLWSQERKMRVNRALLTTLLIVGLMLTPLPGRGGTARAAGVIYVDADAGGADDGSSWTDAYTDLQGALDAAASGDEIWVAEGVYTPGSAGVLTATFQLESGVEVYGGFAGTETARDERDWGAHVTVLSGDIDGNDIRDAHGVVTDTANIAGSNADHVVDGSATTSSAVLDGFFITAGQADGTGDDNSGAGIYIDGGSPTLRNLVLSGNLAGAARFVDVPSVIDTGSGTAPIVDRGAYEAALQTVYLPLALHGD